MPPLPWSTRPDAAGLARKLRRLAQVFPIDTIRADEYGARQVVEYYEQCHGAYRKHHSAEGAVHMGLNEGDRFDPIGFYGPLRRIEAGWLTRSPQDVLELGFGQGFNLADLGSRHPRIRFTGIDLTPAHLALAENRIRDQGLQNVSLCLGDFHRLPFADASFDHLFAIEVFCYATDIDRAFSEIARVLRPGGVFTLFDGYLTQPIAQLSADEALTVELIAKGMAIDHLQSVDEIFAHAQRSGLGSCGLTVLDTEVMPTLRRLERLTAAVVRIPLLGRWALARRPPMRGRNVLAGFLMRTAVAMGFIGYRQIELRKAPSIAPSTP
jgi:SAM-dependent methyltransferase